MIKAGVLGLSMALTFACGGTTPAAKMARPAAWQDMDLEQRTAFMKDTVMPEMTQLFTEFDGEFASMDCKTCHGPGAEDTSFEMPNPDLWVLPSEAGWATFVPDEDQTKWLEFMGGKVKPAMAKLLGMSDFDYKTGDGDFNCSACHTTATE